MTGKLLTVKEVADRLAVSESTVFRLLRSGKLRPIKLGRALRFDEQDVAAFIEQQKAPPSPER